MKKIIKAFKYIVITLVLLLAVILTINTSLFDEELNPEVARLLKQPEYPSVEDNAYFAFWGITADESKDMVQSGHQLIQRYIENWSKGQDDLPDSDYDEILGSGRITFNKVLEGYKRCDTKETLDCISQSKNYITNFINLNPEIQFLLNRYRLIIQMSNYKNFGGLSALSPLASYATIMKLHQIHLIDLYDSNSTEYLESLQKDMLFWKMTLKNSSLLIDKMVAISSIRENALYLSEFLRLNEINEQDEETIKTILFALTPEEKDISESFLAESRFMYKYFIDENSTRSIWDTLFFQPNASANYYYEKNAKVQVQQAQMPLREFMEMRQSNQNKEKAGLKFSYLYNPVGKILADYGSINTDDYVARIHDINNMIKMVRLQFEIKLSGFEDIQDILNQKENLNSYTDKPFFYNKENRSLEFECLDKFYQCKINI